MANLFWRPRPLIALLAAMTVYGQSIDAAAAKVREAEAALREAQQSYRKALLEQVAALRAQADAIEAKARGAVTPVAGNVTVGAPSVRIMPVAAVAAAAPAPAAQPPAPPTPPSPAAAPAKPAMSPEKEREWEARAIFGFHQAGASSAESKQNYFFDFFIMRGLGNSDKVYENRVNLWGNVRIASAPQQIDSSVSSFVANFATKAGELKVNELAQSGEFLTGLGVRLKNWNQGDRVRMLEAVGFWGANGAFSEPDSKSQVYRIPEAGTANRAAFDKNFGADIARLTAGVTVRPAYVGFTPPDRERFYRQFGSGIRLSTFETKRYAPPATYMFTLGRDQLITEGQYKSIVARADVFYPLPIGKEDGRFKSVFLFGTANLRLTKQQPLDVVALEPVSNVPLFQRDVVVISRPSSRDTYRIGAGIDFVNLLNSWRATRSGAGATR